MALYTHGNSDRAATPREMSALMRVLIIVILVAAAVAVLVRLAGLPEPEQRSEAEKAAAIRDAQRPAEEQGTAPGYTSTPPTAVDTDTLPNLLISPDADDTEPLPYYQLAADTYLLYANVAVVDEYNRGFIGNAGFVVTPSGVVVIDSLGTPKLGRRLIATIRSVTQTPITHLILTHNHPDHAFGAPAFRDLPGVVILSHQGALAYLNSDTFDTSVTYRREILGKDMAGFEPVRPDRLIGGERFTKYSLNVGGRRFDIYNVGQHHSHGDLVVHQVDADIVWISDLAFNNRLTYMADGHSKQVLEAEEWLLQQFDDAKLMVPGHGSAQTPPFPMVKQTHDYVRKLRREMREAIDKGLGLNEAVAQAKFPEWESVRLYDQNQRPNAHFVYLEMEQEAF